ncbi:MAG: arginine--tRNA ligase [Thaumarchaeota archaeon]|nr:arginine--tRNA ligase [Nitrososphaerota archaeon]
MFREFEDEVRVAVEKALSAKAYPRMSLELLVPNKEGLGDLSCAVALKLARELKKPPSTIAQELEQAIERDGLPRLVGGVKAHPSGYLNFYLSWGKFAEGTLVEARGGIPNLALESKKVLIEHTNVNPNKALHVGHARNLVLGDSLVRIMRKLGNSVQVVNYIDDSGAQVADVIVGLKFLGFSDQAPPGVKFDAYCGDTIYTGVNKLYEKDPSLKEKQRLVLTEIERGEGEISDYAHSIVLRILADQLKTCWRLGARYDLLNWESHILKTGMWDRVFEQMKKQGVAVLETEGENAGCWVIKDEELGDEKVLVRSDGTVLYVAKDIPYAAWKVGLIPDPFRYDVYDEQPGGPTLWTTTTDAGRSQHPHFGAADLAISVIDAKQSRLQKIVSRVLTLMGGKEGGRYLHRGYEVVALSKKSAESLGIETEKEFVHMQGRKGLYINVDTVLAALKAKARGETKKRNPEESEGWVEEVAEKLAIAAFRFELLKQDPDKMIAFDIEASLELQGETGPYLLYSYARAKRIISKSDAVPAIDEENAANLNNPKEKELIKLLSMFDKAIIEGGEYLNPKEVARYAYSLCALFNEFYEAVQVNSEPDGRIKTARLALVDAFSTTLVNALDLMGIQTLEKM